MKTAEDAEDAGEEKRKKAKGKGKSITEGVKS